MDNRPIGVFDSGLGGLTGVRELAKLLPGEDIVYFGDTARTPYGSRSRDTILRYGKQDIEFLLSKGVKAILCACNTVSSTLPETYTDALPVPFVGVVRAAAAAAAARSASGRIGIIATAATVKSGSYEAAIRPLRPDARLTAQACPLFVPLVEEGRFCSGDVVVETVAAEYLAPLREERIDTLVLGCTHYPLLTEIISGAMGGSVFLVDSGREAACAAQSVLLQRDALAGPGEGGAQFYVSERPADFQRMADIFRQEPCHPQAQAVDIAGY